MKKYICPICGEEIKIGDQVFIAENSEEKIFIHPSCTKVQLITIETEDDLRELGLSENINCEYVCNRIQDKETIAKVLAWISVEVPDTYIDLVNNYLMIENEDDFEFVELPIIEQYIRNYCPNIYNRYLDFKKTL